MDIKTIILEAFSSFHMSSGETSIESLQEPKDGDRVRHKEHGRTGVLQYRKQHGNAMVKWDGDEHNSSVYPHNLEHETPKHQVANDI